MSGLPTALHPSFEALSAHADELDDVGVATRVGRHVARCAQCREEVAEIRALGDAARAVVVAGAPTDLWSRIETASVPSGASGRVHLSSHAADLPAPASRRQRALIPTALTLAATFLAFLFWPRTSSLQAAGPSRLTFTPARPVPGGTVRVRYVPASDAADTARFVLVGRFALPAGQNRPRFGFGGRTFDQLGDSLGELVRAADGAFVATLRLPADFLAVSLAVHDTRTDRLDLDGAVPWMIIGGAPNGAPSLTSYLAAREARTELFNIAARHQPRQAGDVADSLKRYFPRHPAGWAFTQSYGVSRGRFDLLRFFEGAERKYASLSDELWPQPALDAERLHDMTAFADRIDEPTEVMRWAGRLAEEHPEDPRALSDLAGALHQLEMTSAPAAADSIRRWLPALDRAYRHGPVPNVGYEKARSLGIRYGDSSTRALWTGREVENGVVGNIWLMTQRATQDSSGNARAELRRRAEVPCVLPPGRLPLRISVEEWRVWCELDRGIAYGTVSSLTLRAGRPRQALAEADSAIVAMRRAELCASPLGLMAHANAELALGDTATAESDFIASAAAYRGASSPPFDTAQARLGMRFDRTTASVRLDSARQAIRACDDELRSRRQARQRERDLAK